MSVFGNSVGCCGQLSSPFIGLGDTGEEWFKRAKKALVIYENTMLNYGRIPAGSLKRDLWENKIGGASTTLPKEDDGTWNYAYQKISRAVRAIEAKKIPPQYYYEVERRQNRVVRLEDANKEFRSAVTAALVQYGVPLQPPPATPTSKPPVITITKEENKWLTPALIGGGALVFAGVLYFALKK